MTGELNNNEGLDKAGVAVTFAVRVTTRYGDRVAVVGDRDVLGCWKPEGAVLMSRDERGERPDQNIWRTTVLLGAGALSYRYCVYRSHEKDKSNVAVAQWETNLQPRMLTVSDDCVDYKVGVEDFGSYDGKESIGVGWLTGQTETQLRLHSNALHMWDGLLDNYSIKCIPMENEKQQVNASGDHGTGKVHYDVRVSNLTRKDSSHAQGESGALYAPSDYLIYHIRSHTPDYLGYKLEIYGHKPGAGPCGQEETCLVGCSFILPLNLNHSRDVLSLPVLSVNHSAIGHIAVDYLVVKPLSGDLTNMSASYAMHWKERPCVQIGHRGLGTSYSDDSLITTPENTLASFIHAADHVDYIECDVQLSKDQVPVIYHDFTVCVTSNKKDGAQDELIEMPVKDLTTKQLHSMRLHHVNTQDLEGHHDDAQPFPTLVRCLQTLSPQLGMDVEVKYPMVDQNGTSEVEHYFDMNKFVDSILSVLLTHAPPRKIILSCFDPDVCIMLRLKQSRYPVMFLTSCVNEKYIPRDIRTHTLDYAVAMSITHLFLGIVVESCIIHDRRDLVSKVKAAGLKLFCFGSDNTTKALHHLKSLGLDGIIHDGVDTRKLVESL